jgi:hypothetical protein
MSDPEFLLLVLVLIYLTECAGWLRRGSVGFLYWRSWLVFHPGTILGNARGGFMLANPLPPLGCAVIAHQWPVSLSPRGVLAFVAQSVNPDSLWAHTGSFFRWEEIQSVAVDSRKILINRKVFVRTDSTRYARHLAELLQRLAKLAVVERESAVKAALNESLNAQSVEQRFQEFRLSSHRLRRRCNVLFVVLFLLAPALVWRFGLNRLGLACLMGVLGLVVLIAVEFFQQHKRLFPGEKSDRAAPLVTMFLAPPAAIRAWDALARQLIVEFHPLAVARVLCAPDEFRRFARRILLDLWHPIAPGCPLDGLEPQAVEAWFRSKLIEATEAMLLLAKLNLEELTQAPVRAEGSHSYCPRCDSQFVSERGICSDCGGIPLRRFEQE